MKVSCSGSVTAGSFFFPGVKHSTHKCDQLMMTVRLLVGVFSEVMLDQRSFCEIF